MPGQTAQSRPANYARLVRVRFTPFVACLICIRGPSLRARLSAHLAVSPADRATPSADEPPNYVTLVRKPFISCYVRQSLTSTPFVNEFKDDRLQCFHR